MGSPSGEDTRSGPRAKRGVLGLAIAWVVLAAISLMLAFAVAEGEARTHATGHLALGFLSIAMFVSVGLLWTPAEGSRASLVRAGILVITAMGAFGQVFESIGASGYDRFNAGHEIEFLTGIHNAVGILGPVALMAIPIGLVALAVLAIARLLGRSSPDPAV
jgi:hypothetical protein